jgi:hypothetical protein
VSYLPPRARATGLTGAKPLATVTVDSKATKAPENHILIILFRRGNDVKKTRGIGMFIATANPKLLLVERKGKKARCVFVFLE